MKNYNDLNTNEKLVLQFVSISSEMNGGDFTYFDFVIKKMGALMSGNQVKGYLSQLEKKKYITISEGQICCGIFVDFLTDYQF
jgi:hypothetical protein